MTHPLDDEARALLDLVEANPRPAPWDVTVEEFRRQAHDALRISGEPEPVEEIGDEEVPGADGALRARRYRPADRGDGLLVYFHGGGFVFANLDTYQASCLALADMAQCMVVSVAYRQAPEFPFTAAVDDAYAATQYVLASAAEFGGDPARVAVCGESAGGNLAAVVCLRARDEGGLMPIHQALVYPITTYAAEGAQTESIEQFADAIPLNAPMLDWFAGYYLPNPAEDAMNVWASPLLWDDLSGLPPVTMISAEIDPLLSQGTAYVEALTAAGTEATQTIYEGVTHEFFGMGTVIDKAMEAEMEVAQALMTAFGGGGMATPIASPVS